MNSAISTGSQDSRRWLTLAIAASALFLICVDVTVLYIALPVLTRDLGAGNEQRLWIINVYPLVVAGLLPGLGTLGDRHGHRRLFVAGLAAFGLASLAAAFAPTPALLIAARAALGIGGAMMMPATLAIIRLAFRDPDERALAIGLWAGIASGGMALGPVIGGLLLEHFWWGSVFLINVPVILVALALTLWRVPRDAPSGGPPWDVIGSLQIMAALTALIYSIKALAHQPLSPTRVLVAMLSGFAITIVYLRRQRRRPTPLVDFSLFRISGFGAAVAGATLGTAGIVGVELVLGQHLQLVLGNTPLRAALNLLPVPLGAFLAGPLAGLMLRRLDASRLTIIGLLLSALCALLLLARPLVAANLDVAQILLLLGVGAGAGITATCASSAIMGAAPPARGGMAASIEEVGFEFGGALGVAIFGSLMTLVYAANLELPIGISAPPAVVTESLDQALITADALPPVAAEALRATARAAFSRAVAAVFAGAAVLWIITAAWVLLDRHRSTRDA